MRKVLAIACVMIWAASVAQAAVVTEYLGTDSSYLGTSIQGDWVGNIGAEGYHLLYWGANENQKSYPSYLNVATKSGLSVTQWADPGSTTDARAPINADLSQRAASAWSANATGYIRMTMLQNRTFILGLYMLDWDQGGGRKAAIAVCDQSQEAAPPWEVETGSYNLGKWFFTRITAAAGDKLSIRLRATSSNAAAAMLAFDEAPTYVKTFSVSDRASGSTSFTDEATMSVSLAGGGTAAITGYQVTETDTEPTEWLATPPTEYTITAGEGDRMLFGWVKDDQGIVEYTSKSIYYSTAVPVISNVATSSDYMSITIDWDTDVTAAGWVMYGIQGEGTTMMSESDLGTSHSITISDLIDETTYDLEIHSNNTTLLTSATTTASIPTIDNVVWAGRAAPILTWSKGANWLGFQPPENPTAGSITFGDTGVSTTGAVTNTMNPDWQTGGLYVVSKAGTHKTDLGGNTLIVDGDLRVGYKVKTSDYTVTNGTLQVGTELLPRKFWVGMIDRYDGAPATGTMTVTGTFGGYFTDFIVAQGGEAQYTYGTLDLQNATIAGGKLKANNFRVGAVKCAYGDLKLSETCGLTDIEAVNEFRVGGCEGGHGAVKARIGIPASGNDPWKLPTNVNITLGQWDTTRCQTAIGSDTTWGSTDGRLISTSGGDFSGYLSTLSIGRHSNGTDGPAYGVLDIRAMNSVAINAASIEMASNAPAGDDFRNAGKGYIYLPAGTVVTDKLALVHPDMPKAYPTEGIVELNGTVFAVNQTLTIGPAGTVNTHVKGKSAGLDLSIFVTPVVNGAINIFFDQDPDVGETGEYWGLRWEGDHFVELNTLKTAGKLAWTLDPAVTGTASFFFDGTFTYVSVKEEWPPTAVAKDLTVEIIPPDETTIVIDVADIDASPEDPSVMDKTIICAQDTDANPYTVTLTNTVPDSTYDITLTLTRDTGASAFDVGTVTIIEVPFPTNANLTWSGGAAMVQMPRLEWMWGANWLGGSPPDHGDPLGSHAGTLTFAEAGSAEDDSVTNLVNADWLIDGFLGTSTTGNHTTDLDLHSLTIDGDLLVGYRCKAKNYSMLDGTLQVGTEIAPSRLIVGYTDRNDSTSASGVLALPGVTFSGDLDQLIVGQGGEAQFTYGTLDLQYATIADGVLKANVFRVGAVKCAYGDIKLSESSGLTQLAALNELRIGGCQGGHGGVRGRIGDPNNGWKLPPDVNVTLGDSDADTRCRVSIGSESVHGSTEGALIASSGGAFSGCISTLTLGRHQNGTDGNAVGTLDLRAMNSVQMDAEVIELSPYLPAADLGRNTSKGYLYLPAGTAMAGDVTVLHPEMPQACAAEAVLELNGTVCTISTSLKSGPRGRINTFVNGASAGLDLADAIALTINGTITIAFTQDQAEGQTGEYWGLRWAGDHRAALAALNGAGKLVWTLDPSMSGSANVFYDGTYTYVAVKESWPPTAVANDLTIEVRPPDYTTIVLTVDDIDASPDDPSVVDRTITCLQDTDSDPATVTLEGVAAPSSYDITLMLTREGGAQATDVGTMTVVDVAAPAPVDENLTWSGGAGTAAMPRTEWLWGANWLGGDWGSRGAPPANPALGTVIFTDAASVADDSVTNSITEDRTVGGFSGTSTAGNHKTDLAGHRLTVAGDMLIGYRTKAKTYAMDNGTLQIGAAFVPGNLVVGKAERYDSLFATGSLVLSSVVFEPHLSQLIVGQGGEAPISQAALDLTNATVAGGTLSASTLYVGVTKCVYGYVKFKESTGITNIAVTDEFRIASAEPNGGHGQLIGRIGDPDNNYALPPNVSITLGVYGSTRCRFSVGSDTTHGNADGKLVASSGGTLNAYVSRLTLGNHSNGTDGPPLGTVDLRAMDSVTIDATSIELSATAPAGDSSRNSGRGWLYLPAGTVTADTVVVLHPDQPKANPATALLDLTGTVFTVKTSLAAGANGSINTHVQGTSCGLDIDGAAAVTMNGTINIVFEQDPTESGVYWGLRWAGDHAAELQALVDAAQLTWDDSVLTEPVGIVTHGGFTYVGQLAAVVNVTGFAVTDATSGSALVTNAATVNVSITAEPAEGQTITGYAVNETGSEPTDGWQASVTSYDIQTASGDTVTLFAFAIDSAGNIGSTSTDIYFNTAAPAVLGSSVADNGDGTATATWTTDILAEGSVNYGPVVMSGATPNTVSENGSGFHPPGTSHSATFSIAAGTNYKLVLLNTEVASAPIYWPRPWPIDGDANMDCRVNILDLIFIRNKLNQDAGTGDNWKADVNEDNRINILDLIFVRNKLNTQCP